MPRWGRTTVLVRDYDEARRFYCDALGFETVFDSGEPASPDGQRYLHLGTRGVASIWLLKVNGAGAERVGHQTAGEPLGVIYVDNLEDALERLHRYGTTPTGDVDSDGNSRFAHVPDLYGNDLVLVEMTD